MIASLPMYDRQELEGAHEHYWGLIRQQLNASGIDAPRSLVSDGLGDAFWTDDNLVLSQTCGYPYRARLHDSVTLVGAPDWGLEDCPAGYYYSTVVVRRDDERNVIDEFAQATIAVNSHDSQSGYIAMRNHLYEKGLWFSQELISGSHDASARLVASGAADIAALDVVSWRLMRQHETFSTQLRVLLKTEATPALPYITAKRFDQNVVFNALENAISRLADVDRDRLGLFGVVRIPPSAYLQVAIPADLK